MVDDVIKMIRQNLREEVDETTISILKTTWERRLWMSVTKTDKCSNLFSSNRPSSANDPKLVNFDNNTPSISHPSTNPQIQPGHSFSQGVGSVSHPNPTLRPVSPHIGTSLISKKSDTVNLEAQKRPMSTEHSQSADNKSLSSNQASQVESASTSSQPPSKKSKVNRFVQLDGGIDDLTDTEDEDGYSEHGSNVEKQNSPLKPLHLSEDVIKVDDEGNVLVFNEPSKKATVDYLFAEGNANESDLDLNDDGDFDENTPNVMICRFEKIIRKKTQWKIEFRYGILSLSGSDIVFNKAVAECTF